MKIYWDTSAVINAALSPDVMDRLDQGEHVTRLHTLAEFFSQTTGRGIRFTDADGQAGLLFLRPNECFEWLRAFAERVGFEELDKKEVLDGLSQAQGNSIQGGHVYDYWHALVANKAKADILLTRNTADFKELVPKVDWP